MSKTCKNCTHYKPEKPPTYPTRKLLGDYFQYGDIKPTETDTIFVEIDDLAGAEIIVGPDFGCIHFKVIDSA